LLPIAEKVRRPYRIQPLLQEILDSKKLGRMKSPKQGVKAMQSSRIVSVNGIEMFLRKQGEGPLVMLCHGWPELSYSWRHQIPAIAEAGFHVVAAGYARLRQH
jgi:hypothetical protein